MNQNTNARNAKKPNILLVMADQMAAPILPIYNKDSKIKMPNLMNLANEGVVFESCYTNAPLCAPSRFTMVTGQLPSKIGAFDNASELSSEIPTFAHYLRLLGYHTALTGKMHFIGADQLHGYEQRLTSDIYPGDFGWSANWDEPDVRLDYFHNMASVTDAGVCVRSNQIDYDEEVMYQAQKYLYNHVRRNKDQPFFLTVSLTHPHDPYTTRKQYWDLYEDVEIPLPVNEPAQEDLDPHSQRIQKVIDLWDKPLTDEQKVRARRAYFANCSYVDENIGKLRKVLEECQLTEDTIIVFSGDHGDMLGERNLWYKMNFFEMSARIPLVIHYPKEFEATRVKQSVSSIDYLPTFVDLATKGRSDEIIHPGLPLDGHSIYPYCIGRPGRDLVYGEYMGEGTISPLFMIRTGKWKYISCPSDPPQLFNVEEDPFEMVNLADRDEETMELVRQFENDINTRCDINKITQKVLISQRQRALVWSTLKKGKMTHWDFQPFFDTKKEFVRNGGDILDDLEAVARFPYVAPSAANKVAAPSSSVDPIRASHIDYRVQENIAIRE